MSKFNTFNSFFKSNKVAVCIYLIAILFSTVDFFYSLFCFLFLFVYGRKKNGKAGKGYLYLIILLFSIFFLFAVRNPGVSFHNALWFCVLPLFAFFVGRQIGFGIRSELYFVYWLFILMLSLSLNSIPITILDIAQNGLVNPERNLQLYVEEENTRAVTSRAMDLSLALTGFCCFFLSNTLYKSIRKWFLLFAVFAILCIFHYVSRTGIVLATLSIIIGLWFTHRNVKSFFVILLFALFVYYFTQTTIFDVYAAREEEASSLTATGRFDHWLYGFIALINHPSGYSGYYSHNYWLDFGRDGGLISALLLFVFNISILIHTVKFSFKCLYISLFLRCLLFAYVFISFIAAFTEPIHTGSPGFTWVMMSLCGIVSSKPEKRIG